MEKKSAEKLLMDARNYYEKEFNRKLDDEVLLFFISVSGMVKEIKNEMQLSEAKTEKQFQRMTEEIKSLPARPFRKPFDYFLYGMGQVATAFAIAAVILLMVLIARAGYKA